MCDAARGERGRRKCECRSRAGGRTGSQPYACADFVVLGALTAAAVLFSHLYQVNAAIYDPSLFAIGVCGLFSMACGVILMLLSRNRRLGSELRRAAAHCEELADHTWELKEAQRALAEARDAAGAASRAKSRFSPWCRTKSARR